MREGRVMTPDTEGALRRLQEKLVAMGVRIIGFTWAPGAENLTADERAADVLKLFDAMDRGAFKVLFDSRDGKPEDAICEQSP